MMEVQRHSVQSARRSDKMFSPEGLPTPPASTGLSLGVNGMDSAANMSSTVPNTGSYSSSVTSMRTPLPNATVGGGYEMQGPPVSVPLTSPNQGIPTPPAPLVPVGNGDFMSLSPPGIISGNQAVFLSRSAELPASVPAYGFGTMPMMAPDAPLEVRSENDVIVSGDLNQCVSRDISPTVAAPDNEIATGNVEGQLPMVTESDSLLERSKPDLNIGYNEGETQVVSESQLGADSAQPGGCLAGETQPVNDEGFDDMVLLQNDTLTASTMPVSDINGGEEPASLYEPLQIVDTPPLEPSLGVTTSAPSGVTEVKVLSNLDAGNEIGPTEPHINKPPPSEEAEPNSASGDRQNKRVDTEGPGPINGGQARKEGDLDTTEPRIGVSSQDGLSADNAKKSDEMAPMKKRNSGNPHSVKKQVLIEEEIQVNMGRKVMKKFGNKNYKGEVADYDSENQWFKVVYEDGDQEDLELVEVMEILLTEDNTVDASTAKRKKPPSKGGARKARKQKTKSQDIRKPRGRPRKKDSATQAKKPPQKVKSLQVAKPKGSKRGASATKNINAGVETEWKSPAKSKGKGKRSSEVETQQEITRTDAIPKRGRKNQLSTTKSSIGKSPLKNRGRKATQKGSGKTKWTKRRSLSNLPAEQSRGKRRKVDTSDDLESFVGKMVEKDFDGTLYKGTVINFDRKSEYYKVKYEDDDQEDLEFEELKAVLME